MAKIKSLSTVGLGLGRRDLLWFEVEYAFGQKRKCALKEENMRDEIFEWHAVQFFSGQEIDD